MTRGGVSKASKGINLSEDIFAGFNHLLRGGTIPYVEYVQVGPSPPPQQHAVITVIQDDAATAATRSSDTPALGRDEAQAQATSRGSP